MTPEPQGEFTKEEMRLMVMALRPECTDEKFEELYDGYLALKGWIHQHTKPGQYERLERPRTPRARRARAGN